VSDVEGRSILKRQAGGPMSEAAQLGGRLANELLDTGGREILRRIDGL